MPRFNPAKTLVLPINIQEGYRSCTPYYNEIVKNARKLSNAARSMNAHIVNGSSEDKGPSAFQQPGESAMACNFKADYPESMVVDQLRCDIQNRGITVAILCGFEAHVHILDTAEDLKNMGVTVFVVSDATGGGGGLTYRERAFQRLRVITTAEAINGLLTYGK